MERQDGCGDGDDELALGWRPPRGGKQAQRDNCPEVDSDFVAEIQK